MDNWTYILIWFTYHANFVNYFFIKLTDLSSRLYMITVKVKPITPEPDLFLFHRDGDGQSQLVSFATLAGFSDSQTKPKFVNTNSSSILLFFSFVPFSNLNQKRNKQTCITERKKSQTTVRFSRQPFHSNYFSNDYFLIVRFHKNAPNLLRNASTGSHLHHRRRRYHPSIFIRFTKHATAAAAASQYAVASIALHSQLPHQHRSQPPDQAVELLGARAVHAADGVVVAARHGRCDKRHRREWNLWGSVQVGELWPWMEAAVVRVARRCSLLL